MSNRFWHADAPRVLGGLISLSLLAGCASLDESNGQLSGNRALIRTFPTPEHHTGLRLVVKDNIDLKGQVTTAGSEYLAKNGKPARRDAACLAIVRQRNVHIVGKANMSEFAISPSGINGFFGTPVSPFSGWRKVLPGGSSSGSAVAVARDLADVAFGTDTAGSIRVPAAFCGVVGLKTTHGLVPLDGVFPIEPDHLDTVGPIAKNIHYTVEGMDLLQEGFAARYQAATVAKPAGHMIRIGRLHIHGTDRRIDAAIDQALAKAGFQVMELDEPFHKKWDQAKADGNRVAEAGAWISDKDYRHKHEIHERTKIAILAGELSYLTHYKSALARRDDWQRTLRSTFQKVDLIALPTLKSLPLKMTPDLDTGLTEEIVLNDQNTVAVNYAGNPALAIPIAVDGAHVPVTSLQLIGPNFSEAALLNAGRIVEASQRLQ